MTNNDRRVLFAIKSGDTSPELIRGTTGLTTGQVARSLLTLVSEGMVKRRTRGVYVSTVMASQPLIEVAKPQPWYKRFF